MEGQIGHALTVMIVGMLTVIGILSLVVFSGRILISILNSTGFKLNKSDDEKTARETDDTPKQLIALAIKKWSSNTATPLSIKRIK